MRKRHTSARQNLARSFEVSARRAGTTRQRWGVGFALLDLLLLLVLWSLREALVHPSDLLTLEAPPLVQVSNRAPLALSGTPIPEPFPSSRPAPSALAAPPPSAAAFAVDTAAPSAATRPLRYAPHPGISGRQPGASDIYEPWGAHE